MTLLPSLKCAVLISHTVLPAPDGRVRVRMEFLTRWDMLEARNEIRNLGYECSYGEPERGNYALFAYGSDVRERLGVWEHPDAEL